MPEPDSAGREPPAGRKPPPPGRKRHTRDRAPAESDARADNGEQRHDRPSRRTESDVDRTAARLAGAQKGNISHAQLRAAGLTGRAIGHRIARGNLHPRHRGVYALGHLALPPFSAEMAAVLACGPRALLSHSSAAHLWGFRPAGTDQIIDVTVISRQVRQRPGIRAHRATELSREDVCQRNGIPVTSAARTLIDVASTLEDRQLERALHEALVSKLLNLEQMRVALARYPRRRGCARLVELSRSSQMTVTRSGGEEALYRLIRKSGLPQPDVNARIDIWTVDFYWPQFRLVVEVDGSDFHRTRWSVERDRRKDLDLRGRHLDVLRFAGAHVKRQPEMVLVTIARAMS